MLWDDGDDSPEFQERHPNLGPAELWEVELPVVVIFSQLQCSSEQGRKRSSRGVSVKNEQVVQFVYVRDGNYVLQVRDAEKGTYLIFNATINRATNTSLMLQYFKTFTDGGMRQQLRGVMVSIPEPEKCPHPDARGMLAGGTTCSRQWSRSYCNNVVVIITKRLTVNLSGSQIVWWYHYGSSVVFLYGDILYVLSGQRLTTDRHRYRSRRI